MTLSTPLPVHDTWTEPLAPVADQIHQLGDFLREENAAGRGYLPAGTDVLRAFTYPFDKVKVLIVGQDPYPTPGHPMGLSFSVHADVQPIPRSLVNIFRELQDDIGCHAPSTGDLTPWSEHGVALFNRVLTVRPGHAGSHRGKGWEEVTECAIKALAQRNQPLVVILWGRDAQSTRKWLGDTPAVCSPHPSPLSASRGFFGSRPFSRVNELLVKQGEKPVEWALP
ncbi:uracil-DNA glycosylase [Corynebacterium kroppenstedtii]|uniref:uracil-DNA glycosylase n=1 Tax=Corynebacterium sp. PCR 32 TaxID=3351342 RepID=UPI0030985A27